METSLFTDYLFLKLVVLMSIAFVYGLVKG